MVCGILLFMWSFGPLVTPKGTSIIANRNRYHVPNTATVLYTSNIPQDDTGNAFIIDSPQACFDSMYPKVRLGLT